MPKSYASLDSVDGDSDDLDYDDGDSALAQKEWEESLSQLTQVFSVVLLPYFGKWLGRRYAYAGTPDVLTILRLTFTDISSKHTRAIYKLVSARPSLACAVEGY